MFGQNFHTMTTIENRYVLYAILALNKRNGVYAQCPRLAWLNLELLWSPVDRLTLKECLRWRQEVGDRLKDAEKTSKSLFSTVLNARDPETGEEISYTELMAEAQTLLVAGKLPMLPSNKPR